MKYWLSLCINKSMVSRIATGNISAILYDSSGKHSVAMICIPSDKLDYCILYKLNDYRSFRDKAREYGITMPEHPQDFPVILGQSVTF